MDPPESKDPLESKGPSPYTAAHHTQHNDGLLASCTQHCNISKTAMECNCITTTALIICNVAMTAMITCNVALHNNAIIDTLNVMYQEIVFLKSLHYNAIIDTLLFNVSMIALSCNHIALVSNVVFSFLFFFCKVYVSTECAPVFKAAVHLLCVTFLFTSSVVHKIKQPTICRYSLLLLTMGTSLPRSFILLTNI